LKKNRELPYGESRGVIKFLTNRIPDLHFQFVNSGYHCLLVGVKEKKKTSIIVYHAAGRRMADVPTAEARECGAGVLTDRPLHPHPVDLEATTVG
jgi:hypothetical protein